MPPWGPLVLGTRPGLQKGEGPVSLWKSSFVGVPPPGSDAPYGERSRKLHVPAEHPGEQEGPFFFNPWVPRTVSERKTLILK